MTYFLFGYTLKVINVAAMTKCWLSIEGNSDAQHAASYWAPRVPNWDYNPLVALKVTFFFFFSSSLAANGGGKRRGGLLQACCWDYLSSTRSPKYRGQDSKLCGKVSDRFYLPSLSLFRFHHLWCEKWHYW